MGFLPLQYSCLENPIDRGSWQATVHGVTKKLDMTKQLVLSGNAWLVSAGLLCYPG